MKKLTIGMVTYDDYSGVYFSIQSIRLYHKEVLNEIEFIVIDNNPSGSHGKLLEKFCNSIPECRYIPFNEYKSTSIRSKIFDFSNTPYVLVMDCHVMLEQGSLRSLIDFYDSKKDDGNLLQGPLYIDSLKTVFTHFDLKWKNHMWGTWGTDSRGNDIYSEPFEIECQGLGVFSCRKDSWLGFHPKFIGFGGEEGYIHKKYKKYGKKTLCLPFLRWVHRFGRPDGVPYPIYTEHRVKNYILGFRELGLDTQEIYDHFKIDINNSLLDKWFAESAGSINPKDN